MAMMANWRRRGSQRLVGEWLALTVSLRWWHDTGSWRAALLARGPTLAAAPALHHVDCGRPRDVCDVQFGYALREPPHAVSAFAHCHRERQHCGTGRLVHYAPAGAFFRSVLLRPFPLARLDSAGFLTALASMAA